MTLHFSSKKVTKAVFPVAGFGTRFLPATKASPKEMLNVVDKPLIQYAVDEAIAAGITELIFVTGRSKRAIEDHFDKAYELEAALEAKNKQDLLHLVRSVKPDNVDCVYIRQSEPLGLGHAVLCAEKLVGDEPFAIILADDLLDGQSPVLSQMLKVHEEQDGSVLAVEKIDASKSSSYGIISGSEVSKGIYHLDGIVEKPKPADAPSDLAVVGRYVLSSKIFDHIRNVRPGAGGEIQLTDAIAALLKEEPVFGYEYDGVRYDCGSKLGYLKASVEFALRHQEVSKDFADYLKTRSLT
jgi:UTP--glucose-1-phosphate uridylyltransferase